jgi:hypothetical protein
VLKDDGVTTTLVDVSHPLAGDLAVSQLPVWLDVELCHSYTVSRRTVDASIELMFE